MRMIVVLLALAVIGWLVAQRLDTTSDAGSDNPDTGEPPRVPDTPDEVPAFEKDMNQFMEQQGERRKQQLDNSGG